MRKFKSIQLSIALLMMAVVSCGGGGGGGHSDNKNKPMLSPVYNLSYKTANALSTNGNGRGSIGGNGLMFFMANDLDHDYEPWVTDGTEAGTFMLQDLNPGLGSSSPAYFQGIKEGAMFSAYTETYGRQWYFSDGSPGSAVRLTDVRISTNQSYRPADFVSYGNRYFFANIDKDHGEELWVTDLTPEGTKLFKDIAADAADSYPRQLTVFKNHLFFTARSKPDPQKPERTDLWISDGTPEGTQSINDFLNLTPELQSTGIARFEIINDKMFFIGSRADIGIELWRLDILEDGRVSVNLLADTEPGSGNGTSANPDIVKIGNRFFVTAGAYSDYGVWETDCLPENTRRAISREQLDAKKIYHLRQWSDDRIAIIVENNAGAAFKYALLVSDGTPEGTQKIYETNSTLLNIKPATANRAYFTDTASVYSSDGTLQGTVKVLDNNTHDIAAFPYSTMVTVDDKLYFEAHDHFFQYSYWVSDGTPEGTRKLNDNERGFAGMAGQGQIFTLGTDKLFPMDDQVHGMELWAGTGFADSSRMVKDINTSPHNPLPSGLIQYGGNLLFSATIENDQRELWISDATAKNTRILKKINPSGDSRVGSLVQVGNLVYFGADDGEHGKELWVTDGTPAGTQMVADLNPDGSGFYGYPGIWPGPHGIVYFRGSDGADHGFELWAYNGSELKMISNLFDDETDRDGIHVNFKGITVGDHFYFSDRKGRIWHTSGTEAIMTPAVLHSQGDELRESVVRDNKLFYYGKGETEESLALWLYDFQTDACTMLSRINDHGRSTVSEMKGVEHGIVFTVSDWDDEESSEQLWASDGTADGTTMLRNFYPDAEDADISWMGLTHKGKYYFGVMNATKGEIWSTDGTADGTNRIADLGEGTYQSAQFIFQDDGYLYFRFPGKDTGRELWVTDGTAQRTKLISDIAPGALESHPSTLVKYKGYLYFFSQDYQDGEQLWCLNPAKLFQ